MTKYTQLVSDQNIPQSLPINQRQVKNNAGGYVFAIDALARVRRFLILGSDAPTYYASAHKLTRENAEVIESAWLSQPAEVAELIADVSDRNLAPKNSPAIFALALGVVSECLEARRAAYGVVHKVCRTASHMFEFLSTCRDLGKGFGRGMKRVTHDWYASRSTDSLAVQMVKYRMRNNMTHKRALDLMHKGAGDDEARAALYSWVRSKDFDREKLPATVRNHLAAMAAQGPDVVEILRTSNLPWEGIPTEALTDPDVWRVLVPKMGLNALVRNLGRMTKVGAIAPLETGYVVDRLLDSNEIQKSRLHPFTILQAWAVYQTGSGVRGTMRWKPVHKITVALEKAFSMAFANVEPTGKRIMLALDVSGSMTAPMSGSPLNCLQAGVAMAMVTEAVESNVMMTAFSYTGPHLRRAGAATETSVNGLVRLDLPSASLDSAIRAVSGMPHRGTDCSLPIIYAMKEKLEIDAFVVYTDNETWSGQMHPVTALMNYRNKFGIDAKMVVVAMTSTGFSIADPTDRGMLDVVGFDSSAPAVISNFISGKI